MKKRDILIICGILVFAGLLLLIINLTKKPGAGVIVRINGVEVAKYSFDNEGTYELNGGTNILIIKDNDTFFAAASSSFLLCFLDISTINASPMTLQNAVANEFKRI